MIALIFMIACSTSIGLILKLNDTKKGSSLLLLCANYLAATIIGLIFYISDETQTWSGAVILFSSVLAISFVGTFFIFSKLVGIAGTALATLSSRLSVVIPVALSVIYFDEIPNESHYMGFALTLATIVFFYLSMKGAGNKANRIKHFLYMFLLFAGIGINDFAIKVFQGIMPPIEKPFFLLTLFGFCFLYSFAMVIITKTKFEKSTVANGFLLGIPNILSSFFLISALNEFPAIFVYPAANISIILFTAALAAIFWKDLPDKYGYLALGAGTAAIVILSI